MKISAIHVPDSRSIVQIRSLFGERSRSVLTEQFNPAKVSPLSTIFINAVIKSNILTEAEGNVLQKLLGAGISKLKAALTPGSSEDLDMLLTFVAPQGGGVAKVQELIARAKETDLNTDEDWWEDYFNAFGIDEDSIRRDIRQRVSTETMPPEKQKPQIPGGEEIVGNRNSKSKKRKNGTVDRVKELADQLGGFSSDRKSHLGAWKKELDKQAKRQAKRQANEHLDLVASMICEMDSVKSKMPQLAALIQSELSIVCESKIPPISPHRLQSVLLEGPIDNLRTYLANPRYAKGEAERSKSQHDSTRAAKLAITIAKNHVREKFTAALQDGGMLPNDIANSYKTWKSLQSIPNRDQRQEASFQIASKKLQQAFNLFKPSMGNAPEKNPNDPLDPGERRSGQYRSGPRQDPEIVDAEIVDPPPSRERAKESPPEAKEETPYYIGDDEPQMSPEQRKRARKTARQIFNGLMNTATKTSESGGNLDYAVGSYLMSIKRRYGGDPLTAAVVDMIAKAWAEDGPNVFTKYKSGGL